MGRITERESKPRWIATLEDGRTIVGSPSWLPSEAKFLPDIEGSDWVRLKALCEQDNVKIKTIALYVPPWGIFPEAPQNMGAYGYFEEHVSNMSGGSSGCTAVGICWPEWQRGELVIEVRKVMASGVYEGSRRRKWLPCMIGEPEAVRADKDDGTVVFSEPIRR